MTILFGRVGCFLPQMMERRYPTSLSRWLIPDSNALVPDTDNISRSGQPYPSASAPDTSASGRTVRGGMSDNAEGSSEINFELPELS